MFRRGDVVVSGGVLRQLVVGTDKYGLIILLYSDCTVELLPSFVAEKWCRLFNHDGDNYAIC